MRKVKILFIDDIRNPFDYIKNVDGVFVVIARSAHQAIEALKDYTFDIIFFDHDLGDDRTGYDIAKWIVENNIKIKQGFRIVSANPVGRFNISQLLNHYGYQELS